jgi:hypothetical protein
LFVLASHTTYIYIIHVYIIYESLLPKQRLLHVYMYTDYLYKLAIVRETVHVMWMRGRCQALYYLNIYTCFLSHPCNSSEQLQEFAKFYLANLMFCQLVKRYAK